MRLMGLSTFEPHRPQHAGTKRKERGNGTSDSRQSSHGIATIYCMMTQSKHCFRYNQLMD